MANWKKILFRFGLVVFLLGVILLETTIPVFARQTACGTADYYDPLICGYGEGSNEAALQGKIRNILEVVYLWVGIIAVIVVVIGGIKYMTSQGEPERIKSAKSTIMYAIIGLIVTLAAFAITEFILGALDGEAPSGTATERSINKGEDGPIPDSEKEIVEEPIKRPKQDLEWKVSVVSLSKKTVSLKIGQTEQLSVKVYPENAVDKSIIWASSDENVATVDQEGKILAKSGGVTMVSATSRNNISDIAKVTVINPQKPTISVGKTTLFNGETTKATVKNNSGSIKWSSSNNKVASVDNNGTITANSSGKATIKANVKNEINENIELSVQITVKELKVLWVGNSKTFVEDIDQKFVSIVRNRGSNVSSTRVSAGGSTLIGNLIARPTNIRKYYDVVILQEQTDAAVNEEVFYKGAVAIAREVKKQNNKVIIYIRKTWYKSNNRSTANAVATNVAKRVANDTGLTVKTINDGDTLYMAQNKGYKVFGDIVHQNRLGAYAAAACVAATVLRIDPTTVTYSPSGEPASAITAIRGIAKNNCY